MSTSEDYLRQARAYWRHVPGGDGKIDTAEITRLSDAEFLALWNRAKRVRRQNLWEEGHFITHFAELFADKKVLSFGCGLAFSETDFLDRGATIVFADIIDSNLEAVQRLCRLRGYAKTEFRVLSGDPTQSLGVGYDFIFAYGSIMHMPEENQMQVLRQFNLALRTDGRLLLMLYTPRFVESTGSEFDPRSFALRSDPSVGDIANPWSDWHDDAKLSRVAPDFVITNRQTFHEDRFVWYALVRAGEAVPSFGPFIDLIACAERDKSTTQQVEFATFVQADAIARVLANGEILVVTGDSAYHYAIKFPEMKGVHASTMAFEIDVIKGGASVGLLDVASDSFIATKSATATESRKYYIELPKLPDCVQVVISNFQPRRPASSVFIIKSIKFMTSAIRA